VAPLVQADQVEAVVQLEVQAQVEPVHLVDLVVQVAQVEAVVHQEAVEQVEVVEQQVLVVQVV